MGVTVITGDVASDVVTNEIRDLFCAVGDTWICIVSNFQNYERQDRPIGS